MTEYALLVLDVQRSIADHYGNADYLTRLRGAIDAARAAQIPVIHVVVGFRDGHPEANPRNKMLAMLGSLDSGIGFTPDDPGAEIHPDVAPLPGEPVV
ncbi:MAG TPA: isochorismatase family protein, partial [Pseudonocardiaceae bacterium]